MPTHVWIVWITTGRKSLTSFNVMRAGTVIFSLSLNPFRTFFTGSSSGT